MIPRPPRSTRTDTLFPYTTLFLSISARRHSNWPKWPAFPAQLVPLASVGSALGARSRGDSGAAASGAGGKVDGFQRNALHQRVGRPDRPDVARSEERRVGKECVSTGRSQLSPYYKTKKTQIHLYKSTSMKN